MRGGMSPKAGFEVSVDNGQHHPKVSLYLSASYSDRIMSSQLLLQHHACLPWQSRALALCKHKPQIKCFFFCHSLFMVVYHSNRKLRHPNSPKTELNIYWRGRKRIWLRAPNYNTIPRKVCSGWWSKYLSLSQSYQKEEAGPWLSLGWITIPIISYKQPEGRSKRFTFMAGVPQIVI